MDIKKLISSLHPLERKVLPILLKFKTLNEVIDKSGLPLAAVMRSFQWMENKSIVKLKEDAREVIVLGRIGQDAASEGLPEKRFLKALKSSALRLEDLKKAAKLEDDELNACIGILKRKVAIDIKREGTVMIFSITDQGRKLLEKDSLEDLFLARLNSQQVELASLKPEEVYALDNFKKRKEFVSVETLKTWTAEITDLGRNALKAGIDEDTFTERLTHEMLKKGEWKGKQFRRFDVEINVPKIYAGKRHFVNQAKDYAKQVWLDMGFKEMAGPMLNTSFWNFDALFTAQDHPVREMQDTYYIDDPKLGKLPSKKLVDAVRNAHEKGTKGSTGWQYKWAEENAKRNVLRTHTTVLSAKTLAQLKKDDWPAKYFSIGKCFRNETLDWSHLFEFNQTEGIVVDPDADFRNLLGYLKQFFRKMGFPQARFRPAYFPYTEPSIEIDVFHPIHNKWIELGGAGIFRPEVTEPLLGEEVPVLAWGPGFDRIILDYYKITDIRDLYKNDIKQLREMKAWMR